MARRLVVHDALSVAREEVRERLRSESQHAGSAPGVGFGVAVRTRGYPAAPLLLALVLSGPIEANLRRALIFSNGDPTTC
jgi:hypothetical protein